MATRSPGGMEEMKNCICPPDFNHNRGHSNACYLAHKLANLIAITCEICDAHVCWAYDNDLNGSIFVCDVCKPKPKQENI